MSENEKNNGKLVAQLRQEIATLKSIIYKMPGNIFWKNLEGELLGCNLNMARALNLISPEDVIGKRASDYVPMEVLTEALNNDAKVIATKKEMSVEENGINEEGNPAVYVSKKSPFYDEKGNIIGLIGISVDITYQKKIEEKLRIAQQKAEAANQAKSQFLAMISHEIRIPLTSLLGFTGFLQEESLTLEEQKTYLGHITYSGHYLLDLVNRLLDYSKLEAEKTELRLTSINFKELISDVRAMLTGMASAKDLPIYLNYQADVPENFMADARAMQQILVNLVGNAVKYTQFGCITIQVSCLEKTYEMATLEISVQDTGIGIPEAKLRDIFKEFYQVDDIYTRKTSVAGTGLGLAIVRKLVKLVGGKIDVKSKPDVGSTFTLTLSLPRVADSLLSSAKIAVKDKALLTSLPDALTVLLVEDDMLVQFVHQKMLTNLGCRVDAAENSRKALSMLKNDYKIIFVDIGLPDFNGFDLMKVMRQQYKLSVPIIALTGFFTEEEKERCLASGADAVLVKPVSQALLKDVLTKYIN